MNEITRWECTPQEYIRELFNDTKEGKLMIMYYPGKPHLPYKKIYEVDWKETDVDLLIKEYERLTSMFIKFGKSHRELENCANLDELLTEVEREVWNTYILPYEPFDVEEGVINELYCRGEFDQLDDDENDLLERHYCWKQEQSLKRLPQKGCVPTDFIEEARWYEYHAQVGSKGEFLQEPGKNLAREMVLYYHGVDIK